MRSCSPTVKGVLDRCSIEELERFGADLLSELIED
jgi:hypothetical protein